MGGEFRPDPITGERQGGAPECYLAQRLGRESVAVVAYYPEAPICAQSGCELLGRDVLIDYNMNGAKLTVKSESQLQGRQPALGCCKETLVSYPATDTRQPY